MAIRLSFVLGESFSSRLISWWGQGLGGWSHVDAVLPSGELLGARCDSIGGQAPGVRIRPAKYETWKRWAVVELAGPEGAWELWLRQQIGEPYDHGAIVSFILGERDHQLNHWICSACQFEALVQVKILNATPVLSWQITPDTLFVLVTAGLGGKIISQG